MYDFSKMSEVELSDKGERLTPGGRYALKIERCVSIESKKDAKPLYIVEFVVESSTAADIPVGSKRSWVQNIQNPAVGMKAVKGFLAAALGLDSRTPEGKAQIEQLKNEFPKLAKEALEDAKHPDICKNILAGRIVECEVVTIETKPTNGAPGHPFDLHKFSPAEATSHRTALP